LASGSVCADLTSGLKRVARCSGASVGLDRVIYPMWALLATLRLRRQQGVDVIVTTPYRPALCAGYMALKLGIPWVADIWDDPALGYQILHGRKGFLNVLRRGYRGLQVLAVGRMLPHADLVVSVIPEVLRARYGVSDQRLHATPNGVDLVLTDPGHLVRGGGGFTAVYVGPVMKTRGVGVLLDAAASLRDSAPDFRLRLIGRIGRGDARWLFERIDVLGVSAVVDVVGELPHARVLEEIARAEVCLSPLLEVGIANYTHACPIKILEYLAMGKAVIATNLPGSRGLVEDGVNGLLVCPGAVDDLVGAIERLRSDPELRARLEGAARKSVSAYDWNRVNASVYQRIRAIAAPSA